MTQCTFRSLSKEVTVGGVRFERKPINVKDARWVVSIKDGDQITSLKVLLECCDDWWDLISPELHIYPITFFCAICNKGVIVHPPIDIKIKFRHSQPELVKALVGEIIWVEKENINEDVISK